MGDKRYCIQPPYIEPPSSSPPNADNVVSLQLAYNNLNNQLDVSQRTNETLHNKLGQLAVHLNHVQQTSSQNAQQAMSLREENERLKTMLQKTLESQGVYVPDITSSREVDQRLRNLEDFCHKLSERESDRSDRLSASSGGISISNISLTSSAALINEHHVYKDACSTSEYSSLCSLDRVDGMSLREKVLELETNAVKQDARVKILERNLQERNHVIKRLKAELEQFRPSSQQLAHYTREFTQI